LAGERVLFSAGACQEPVSNRSRQAARSPPSAATSIDNFAELSTVIVF